MAKLRHVQVQVLPTAVGLREPSGRVKRSRVLRWFDNAEPDGRYLDHSERDSTGEMLYLLTPADAQTIGGHIEQLVTQVR